MKKNFHECGTPAFNNIEEVLAEKIVDHSKKHCDFSEREEKRKEELLFSKKCMWDNKKIFLIIVSLILLVIPIIIFIRLLLLFKFSPPRKK